MSLRINVGAIEPCTTAMGPGKRFCVWVRGCPLRCPGCATPEFLERDASCDMDPDDLVARMRDAQAQYGIEGISFSGGEPFHQAHALAYVANQIRPIGLSALCWSGYTLSALRGRHAPSGSAALLATLDVLVDGPFVRSRITNVLPLRGSTNQRIHFLTDRYDVGDVAEANLEAAVADPKRLIVSGVTDAQAMRTVLQCLGVTDE